jgi:hypothetical protein
VFLGADPERGGHHYRIPSQNCPKVKQGWGDHLVLNQEDHIWKCNLTFPVAPNFTVKRDPVNNLAPGKSSKKYRKT